MEISVQNIWSIVCCQFEAPRIGIEDTLDVTGFEIIVDYEKNIAFRRYDFEDTVGVYFPVYIVNSTSSDKVLLGKDSYVFGLQEALDEDRRQRWRPIESRGFDF